MFIIMRVDIYTFTSMLPEKENINEFSKTKVLPGPFNFSMLESSGFQTIICIRITRRAYKNMDCSKQGQGFWFSRSRVGLENFGLLVSKWCWCFWYEDYTLRSNALELASSSSHHCCYTLSCKAHQQITFLKPKCSLEDL